MPAAKIKEKEVVGNTYVYEYSGWDVRIKNIEDGERLYLLSRPGIAPMAAYVDGELVFHFDKGNTYKASDIPNLCAAVKDLEAVSLALKQNRFSAQKAKRSVPKKEEKAATPTKRRKS